MNKDELQKLVGSTVDCIVEDKSGSGYIGLRLKCPDGEIRVACLHLGIGLDVEEVMEIAHEQSLATNDELAGISASANIRRGKNIELYKAAIAAGYRWRENLSVAHFASKDDKYVGFPIGYITCAWQSKSPSAHWSCYVNGPDGWTMGHGVTREAAIANAAKIQSELLGKYSIEQCISHMSS